MVSLLIFGFFLAQEITATSVYHVNVLWYTLAFLLSPDIRLSLEGMSLNATCYDPDGSVLTGNYPCGFSNLTSQMSSATSKQSVATPSQTSSYLLSQQPTDQNHNLKTGIEIGLPVAIVIVLLAIIVSFVFQNRKFKRQLIQLHSLTGEGSLGREVPEPEFKEREGDLVAELDLTRYEMTQREAQKHELLGNGIHESSHKLPPARASRRLSSGLRGQQINIHKSKMRDYSIASSSSCEIHVSKVRQE